MFAAPLSPANPSGFPWAVALGGARLLNMLENMPPLGGLLVVVHSGISIHCCGDGVRWLCCDACEWGFKEWWTVGG